MTVTLTTTLAVATSAMTIAGAAAEPATSQGPAAQGPAALVPEAGVPMPLWPGGAPGALGTADEDIPTLTKYEPKTPAPTGTAVVVCPGGGYTHLAMDHEGKQIAEWLNTLGITAFVLKYRLGPRYHHPVMQQDVQRALRIVRAGAGRMNLREDRIGVMGFSAGGHLASTAATHVADGQADAADPVERVGSRPDFAILGYPVITMGGPYVHKGSLKNLLGEQPDPALVELMSNEKQVTARTPPTFLFHTDDDPVVPVQNAIMFFEALKAAGVPGELHIYAHGKHGVGLAQADPVLSTWPARLADWLRVRELLPMPASWPTPAPAQPPAR
jgi:acetyl esterase/lipase